MPDKNNYNYNAIDVDITNKDETSNSIYSYAQQPPEDINDADVHGEKYIEEECNEGALRRKKSCRTGGADH